MRTVLLSLRGRTRTTGKFLANALNVEFAARQHPNGYCHLLIRWGNSGNSLPSRYVINGREAIADAAKKDKALYIMGSEGVKVPNFLILKQEGDEEVMATYIPGFLRGRYHQGGNKLKYVTTLDEYTEAMEGNTYDYIVKEIIKTQEWRIHVGGFMGAELLYVQRKLRRPGAAPNRVWNHDNGWTFNTRSPSTLANYVMIDEAKRAVAALGLDFGAVDILIDATGAAWVIEVNTAPALTITPSQNNYVKFFEEAKANVQNSLDS